MKKIVAMLLVLMMLLPAALAEDSFSFGVFRVTGGEGWTGSASENGMFYDSGDCALNIMGVDLQSTGMAEMANMLGAGLMMDMVIQSSYASIADVGSVRSFTLDCGVEGRRMPVSIGEGMGLSEMGMLCHGGYMLMIMSIADTAEAAVLGLDEALTWITLQEAAQVEAEKIAPALQPDGSYYLANGDMTIVIDNEKYNVMTQNNPEDSPALARMGYNKTQADNYMTMSNKDMMVIPVGGDINDLNLSIRIKDAAYEGEPDVKDMSDAEQQLWMTALAQSFGVDECVCVEMESATYCVFDVDLAGQSQRRYATIMNGDMIYIWAERGNGPLTADDVVILEELMNGITFGK